VRNSLERRRRKIAMKTVVRTMFVVFLLLIGAQIPSHRVVPDVAADTSPPLIAKEHEVREFLSQYLERYNKREIEEFLSLFSLKARQNQQDGVPEIRLLYSEFFNEMISVHNSIEDMKIEIYQNAAEVKARFSVNQVLKKGGEKKVLKGSGRWVLIKENGLLKILSIN